MFQPSDGCMTFAGHPRALRHLASASVPRSPAAAVARRAGQTTVEWTALVALVSALLVAVLAAAGAASPAPRWRGAIAARIVCAIELDDTCADEPDLVAAYGIDTAAARRRARPARLLRAGDDRAARRLPRLPRVGVLGRHASRATSPQTDAGLPVTVFVHVVDCREPDAARSRRRTAPGRAPASSTSSTGSTTSTAARSRATACSAG